MSFPTSITAAITTTGTEVLGSLGSGTGLSGLLNYMGVDLAAVETKLGTGASTPASNTILYGTGAGTSAWQGLTSAQLAAVISDETGTGSLVFANSPTIVSPTVASLANMQHNHSNAAGGGQLGTSSLANATVTADKLSTGAQSATTNGSSTTTSISYVNLADAVTTSVSATIGANGLALVSISCSMSNSNASGAGVLASFAASGANTIAAGTDPYILFFQPFVANAIGQYGSTWLITGLTPGATTFALKYAVFSAGTATIKDRTIAVVPL